MSEFIPTTSPAEGPTAETNISGLNNPKVRELLNKHYQGQRILGEDREFLAGQLFSTYADETPEGQAEPREESNASLEEILSALEKKGLINPKNYQR